MTKAERTRQFIIEQAAPIINRKGMAGTSMSDIMEATKLAKGGLYGNFESKDEICLEAYKYLATRLANGIIQAMSAETTATGKLFALLDFYISTGRETNNWGCPILNIGTEADDTNPAIQKEVSESISKFQERVTAILNNGIQNGELLADVDASKFALRMFAMIEGAILVSKVQHNPNQLKLVVDMIKDDIRRLHN